MKNWIQENINLTKIIRSNYWFIGCPKNQQIIGNNENHIASIKKELKKGFETIDLGHLHFYLGQESYIFLSQKKYIGELLNKCGMVECNPLSTTMKQNLNLISKEGNEFEDATKYRQLVGNLIYLTN